MRISISPLVYIFNVLLVVAPAAAQPKYSKIDLGALAPDFPYSTAWGINNRGQVVGVSAVSPSEYHAVLWQNGKILDLGSLGGRYSQATAINSRVQVVGFSDTANSADRHAFLWEQGTIIDLNPFNSHESGAFGINERGQVVGYYRTASSTNAFLWENGVVRDLGPTYYATYINNRGEVAGTSRIGDAWHAVLLGHGGTMTDLGTVGGNSSEAAAINDLGEVVGSSWKDGQHGFLWTHGTMIDLGKVGSFDTWATGINNLGQIVGYSFDGSIAFSRALLWEHGKASVIDEQSGDWSAAYAINDYGQVVGCYLRDNALRAFLYKQTADIDSDGEIACADLAVAKRAFGHQRGGSGFDVRADVNNDGIVDVRDLAFIARSLRPHTWCP